MTLRLRDVLPWAGLGLAIAVISGCGYVPALGPSVEIRGGVAHRMSLAQVEQTVRANVTADVLAVGREIRPFRVVSIRLVAPFERVRPRAAEASTMSFSTNTTTWVVRAEGTFHDCASTCAVYSAAILVVEDARGVIIGRDPAGPTTLAVGLLQTRPGTSRERSLVRWAHAGPDG